MERTAQMVFLPLQERSVAADSMLPSRNIGAVLSGRAFDQRMTWAGGVFNDWFDTDVSLGDSATQFVGRITWLPLISQDESNLLHLGLGLRYTDAKEGLRYFTEPEFNQAPDFVDTGLLDADSSLTWNLEASWRKGPLWLLGEYIYNDVDAPELGNPGFSGYHLTASYALTGEMRGYNRKSGTFRAVPIAKSVNQGGWGAWEFSARWSGVDLNDGLVEGGDLEIYSLGLNWFLTPLLHVNVNYRWITLDRFGVEGESSGFMTRLVMGLE